MRSGRGSVVVAKDLSRVAISGRVGGGGEKKGQELSRTMKVRLPSRHPAPIRARSSKIFCSLASFGNVSHVLQENAPTACLHLRVHHQSSNRRRSFTLHKPSKQLSIFCLSVSEFLWISCRPGSICWVFCYVFQTRMIGIYATLHIATFTTHISSRLVDRQS
jgi:hypothetical protein